MRVTALAKQLVGCTAPIPGTSFSKALLRNLMLAMVRQLDIDTRRGTSIGDVPCLFGILTSHRYPQGEVIRIIAQAEGIAAHPSRSRSNLCELVITWHLLVSWYCTVRHELLLKCIMVPIIGASAYVAVWDGFRIGGKVHLHHALCKPGAPLFYLRSESLQELIQAMRQASLEASGVALCTHVVMMPFICSVMTCPSGSQSRRVTGARPEVPWPSASSKQMGEHTAALSVQEMLRLLHD